MPRLSLDRPLVEAWAGEHRVAMAAIASFDQPPQLGLAAVAKLSRYRGTSRQHTESDLRVFFSWCHERQLAPLTAQRNDLELYLRWLQAVSRLRSPAGCPSSPASIGPASSTACSSTHQPTTCADRVCRRSPRRSG